MTVFASSGLFRGKVVHATFGSLETDQPKAGQRPKEVHKHNIQALNIHSHQFQNIYFALNHAKCIIKLEYSLHHITW